MFYLFPSITLLSDYKSFQLDIDTIRNLWILQHFNELKIKNLTLRYRINNGEFQRKSTIYPVRKMRKHFENTSQLLNYLFHKSYEICHLEVEFQNGWRIKQLPYISLNFYTNSTSERDQLIQKLLKIGGQVVPNISLLEINFSYIFKRYNKVIKLEEGELPFPDEFWTKERKDEWNKNYALLNNARQETAIKSQDTTFKSESQNNLNSDSWFNSKNEPTGNIFE